ncbi:MAG: uracil-DNA glycosylase family protein [Acidimicrobiales bacterium]
MVFGVGSPEAALMFIGEGPGRDEDLAGEPFVGRSGKLLDTLMEQEIGIDRTQCYIANVVKCLRYDAQVQLGDGSWERIGRLVDRHYEGQVKSVDGEGRIVDRRVTGWHRSPLAGRRVFRLSYRTAAHVGAEASVNIHATGDHEVLTESGWTRIDSLPPGARIATGQGLSPAAHDVIVGSLLGDTHVSSRDTHGETGPCLHQPPHATFKAALQSEMEALVSVGEYKTSSNATSVRRRVQLHTLSSSAVRTLAHDFYSGGRKQVPVWVADALNPRSLAIWFLDDGHMRACPTHQPRAEIHAGGLDAVDRQVLVKGLDRLGLTVEVERGRIQFDEEATRRLAGMIAPYVPGCMRHILPSDLEAEVRFDVSLFADEVPVVQFDEAVVEEVKFTGTDKTFFCIDVEEAHNFVTAGGVVHNCRPPGNRDPKPEEIAECRPYLDRQIELIQPSVVVTLGNFATRTILETMEGITALRGRAYPFRGGHVVPTYHPAAALRGGGGKVAEMRADFVRAKRLLGEPAAPAAPAAPRTRGTPNPGAPA